MKKKVYLVQASAVYGESIKTAYLPYAAGCLAAYAWQNEEIKQNYELGRFIFIREDIDAAIASLSEPYLVGFSSYVWNMEYNIEFAKRLKKRFPNVIIVFGGHNVKPDGSDLTNIPCADIIMHGEGEISFCKLLTTLINGGELNEINNISFRKDNQIITTEYKVPPVIEEYPSPYLEGYFDDIISNSGISPSIIWETNRGCPNRCAFCDWGALKSKIRMFSMERITAELNWMVKNKIEYVYCADANFGLFERDTLIADMIINSKAKYGYPQVFKTNYTKNKDEVVFEISKKLIENRIGKSPTLSFQSLSPAVLKNIGRSNMELDHFKSLMANYSKAGIPVYSELIIGLPGETYESFANGINSLLVCNQHTSIGVYPCELLPNSLLGSNEYKTRFSIKTVKTGFTQYHIVINQNDIPEHSNIITETNTMTTADWKRSFIFSVCVQALHNLALTRAAAIYLYAEKGISYKSFYEDIISYFQQNKSTSGGRVYAKISELTDNILSSKGSFSYVYGEKEQLTWSFEEYMFIYLAKHSDEFYSELSNFLKGYNIDGEIFADLMLYQRSVIKKPQQNGLKLKLNYNFYNYFRSIYTDSYMPLKKQKNTLTVKDNAINGFDEWARICVWYGRRDDAQLYTGKRNTVEQTFD